MIALVIRVAAAFSFFALFSQSAEFTQQYLQRLGGATDALAVEVQHFDEAAVRSGLSREGALAALKGNRAELVVRQGENAELTMRQHKDAEGRYRRLLASPPLFRPFIALADPDWSIAERTREDYRPALPVTIDGLVLAALGFVIGWAGGATAHGAVRIAWRRRGQKMPTS